MAVEDAANDNSATSATSVSVALTISAGSNLGLVAGGGSSTGSGAAAATSAAWNTSESMTNEHSSTFSTNGSNTMWSLINPTSGSHNCVVTWSGTEDELHAWALSVTAANQTDLCGTPQTNTGTGTSVSDTVSSSSDELVVDGVYAFTSGTIHTVTVGSGQTEIGNTSISIWAHGFASYETGAATTTMSWSISSSGYTFYQISVDINAAAGGGSTGKSHPLTGPLGGPLNGPIG